MDLSVVIVSYNVRFYLEQCLRSVFASRGDLQLEVFVVDNNSVDGTVEHLQPLFPDVHFIANSENLGFSRANNQAIRMAQGRYVLLLNPDTLIAESTLTDCIAYIDSHPEVGATGVSMYNSNGVFAWESRRGLPTPWTAFCKMVGLTALFPHSRRFGRYYMRYLDRTEDNYIEVISGAFYMIRREALQQVGMLDESFFMYGEDIDYSYRLLQAGWKNAYVPTPILHYKGESTQKSSYRYVHIFYNAMLIFFNKHFSKRYHLLSIFIRLAVLLRAALDVLLRLWQRMLACLPKPEPQPEHCICIGSASSLEQMCEICRQNNLIGTFYDGTSTTCPDGHLSMSGYKDNSYVVYDVCAYSYGDILRLLVRGAGQGIRLSLGTFNPQTGQMILLNDIFEIKKKS
ncbi:MAG: glycosyltransferase family 2 protein [Bacteroidaceae bacterium]|nr:glycosyltransferase family 2 protein [Bacteroidaceae bacterium]